MNLVSPIIVAIALTAGGAAALAQKSDRITVSPTLPAATAAESRAVDAAAIATLAPGLIVVASDGRTAGKVFEVVRTPQGQINRVLIDASDGRRRSLSGPTVTYARGRAVTTLTTAQILALPVVEP